MFDGAMGIRRAKRLVGHLGQRGFVRWRLKHAIQFGLLPALGCRLELRRAFLKLASNKDRFLNQDRVPGGSIRLKLCKYGREIDHKVALFRNYFLGSGAR